jgi:hypothetical protein
MPAYRWVVCLGEPTIVTCSMPVHQHCVTHHLSSVHVELVKGNSCVLNCCCSYHLSGFLPPQAQVAPHVVAGQKLCSVLIHFSDRTALGEMDPFNAGLFHHVSNMPARQTV